MKETMGIRSSEGVQCGSLILTMTAEHLVPTKPLLATEKCPELILFSFNLNMASFPRLLHLNFQSLPKLPKLVDFFVF